MVHAIRSLGELQKLDVLLLDMRGREQDRTSGRFASLLKPKCTHEGRYSHVGSKLRCSIKGRYITKTTSVRASCI